VLVRVPDVEHLRKVLAQVMRGCTLDASATNRHVQFYSCCVFCTCKALVLTLSALNYRNCKQIFVDCSVMIKNCSNKNVGLIVCCVSSVALLPEKLARSNEGRGMLEFPANDVRPLVEQQRQVTIRVDPLCKARVHYGFTRGADSDRLRKFTLATLSYPGNLWRKAFDVFLLLV
jgi:hypothetical protein